MLAAVPGVTATHVVESLADSLCRLYLAGKWLRRPVAQPFGLAVKMPPPARHRRSGRWVNIPRKGRNGERRYRRTAALQDRFTGNGVDEEKLLLF